MKNTITHLTSLFTLCVLVACAASCAVEYDDESAIESAITHVPTQELQTTWYGDPSYKWNPSGPHDNVNPPLPGPAGGDHAGGLVFPRWFIDLPSGNPNEPSFACGSDAFSPAQLLDASIQGTLVPYMRGPQYAGACNLSDSADHNQDVCAEQCGLTYLKPSATRWAGSTWNSIGCAPVCVFQHTAPGGQVIPAGCYGSCTFTAKGN